MVSLTFNGQPQPVPSIEALGILLDQFDSEPAFELWAYVDNGPSLCMLRNGPHAWLMYLRRNGDSGYTSLGEATHVGAAFYTLSNGELDEYPLAWCVDIESCYKAIAYFYVNGGARPEWIKWQEP